LKSDLLSKRGKTFKVLTKSGAHVHDAMSNWHPRCSLDIFVVAIMSNGSQLSRSCVWAGPCTSPQRFVFGVCLAGPSTGECPPTGELTVPKFSGSLFYSLINIWRGEILRGFASLNVSLMGGYMFGV
jgi:hypothetical protein